MTPTVPAVLTELSALILRNADPAVSPVDRASSLGLTSALLGMAVEVWDGMADRLVKENIAIRGLLARDPAFQALASGTDDSLKISDLKAANDTLRAALIDLHIAAEARDDTALSEAVWAELVTSTDRRRLANAPI